MLLMSSSLQSIDRFCESHLTGWLRSSAPAVHCDSHPTRPERTDNDNQPINNKTGQGRVGLGEGEARRAPGGGSEREGERGEHGGGAGGVGVSGGWGLRMLE